jgi:mannose-1-phosphate guanylyltransferase
MAGGIGSRLWPRSRSRTPKQFLDLLGPRTMLQATVDRLDPLIPLERLLVVVGQEHVALVRDQIPGLPADNILVEPGPRGTAPCIGLAAVALQKRDPGAVMAVFPADHLIADAAGFRKAIAAAAQVAEDDYLVTLGVTPDRPHTGYGYIQRGALMREQDGMPAYHVRRFAEKPNLATAQQFVASGQYYWNGGIFVWRVGTIWAELARWVPALHTQLQALASAWDTPRQGETLKDAWQKVPRTTIDYGVMEHAERVAVLPVDIGWDDVGNWDTLAGLVAQDEQGNSIHGEGHHVLQDTGDSYVYTSPGRLVALVGLDGLIVVDTPNALLVCPKDRAQQVRDLAERLKAEGLEQYL